MSNYTMTLRGGKSIRLNQKQAEIITDIRMGIRTAKQVVVNGESLSVADIVDMVEHRIKTMAELREEGIRQGWYKTRKK